MRKSQAKKLKDGDRVFWHKPNEPIIGGKVFWKRYNTVCIHWDDGVARNHYADSMDNVFTQQQLDDIKQEERMAENIKSYNAELLKKPCS
jgi:hypothetical protein